MDDGRPSAGEPTPPLRGSCILLSMLVLCSYSARTYARTYAPCSHGSSLLILRVGCDPHQVVDAQDGDGGLPDTERERETDRERELRGRERKYEREKGRGSKKPPQRGALEKRRGARRATPLLPAPGGASVANFRDLSFETIGSKTPFTTSLEKRKETHTKKTDFSHTSSFRRERKGKERERESESEASERVYSNRGGSL